MVGIRGYFQEVKKRENSKSKNVVASGENNETLVFNKTFHNPKKSMNNYLLYLSDVTAILLFQQD